MGNPDRLIDVAAVGLAVGRSGIHLDLQLHHIDSRSGGFVALVAQTTAATVEGLLHVVDGQHAERDGHVPLQLQLRDALRDALADEIEMTRIALHDAPEHDDGVDIGILGEELGTQRQLERTGNVLDLNVQIGTPGGPQGTHSTFQQGLCDLAVPFGHHDTEAPLYLYKQALAEQAAGNRTQAAALCERILTDYPMSMEASQAEKLLGGVN